MSDYISLNVMSIYSKLLSHKTEINLFVTLIGQFVVIKIKSSEKDKINQISEITGLEYISEVNYNNDVFIKLKSSKEFERSIIEAVQTYKIME